jgi:ABC transport system ATP-binding/permease protein
MVGPALSALAKSNEQTMPLVIVAVMSQLVLSDGMIPGDRPAGSLGLS